MPFPSPSLFPSSGVFGGTTGPFTDLVLEATSPWDDPTGWWAAYNASLAAMFEEVYDIVADRGDPEQTQVGLLGAPLSTDAEVTSLPVQFVASPIPEGTEITLFSVQFVQLFTTTADTEIGDTEISVEPLTPNFAFPTGTPVQLAYIPGWSSLLDPFNCPDQFLAFLAQFNGTDVPIGLDPATARTKILSEGSQKRGTLASITSTIQRNLSGTQSVFIQERINPLGNPDAYWFVVVVKPEEVINVQALTDSVNAVKPGGVQWTLVQTDGWTISQMEASQATLTGLEGNFVTLGGLENDRPGF